MRRLDAGPQGPVARAREGSPKDADRLEALLEIQRHRLMMFTSCGWFFDDPAGLETVQILRYAHRAIILTRQAGGPDFEAQFRQDLNGMASISDETLTGGDIYDTLVVEHATAY